jgi:hypothetical protein
VFPTDSQNFLSQQPEVQHWLLTRPVDSCELYNALCYLLPFIADADPAFAKLALDPDTWRRIVLSDPHITQEDRTTRLERIDGHFAHALNNALLHVLGSLANNHFLLIDDYLEHIRLRGGYTHLMPQYLFAVLFDKVAMLRGLCQDGFWTTPRIKCSQ